MQPGTQNALHSMIRASASRRLASRPARRSSSTRAIGDEPWWAADRRKTSGSKQDWCRPISQNDTCRSHQGEGEGSGEVCTTAYEDRSHLRSQRGRNGAGWHAARHLFCESLRRYHGARGSFPHGGCGPILRLNIDEPPCLQRRGKKAASDLPLGLGIPQAIPRGAPKKSAHPGTGAVYSS